MNIEIKELQTINLKKDEVLVVKLNEDVTQHQVASLRDSLKKLFPSNDVMIFTGDVEFSTISVDD